jgi:hypothetical protein
VAIAAEQDALCCLRPVRRQRFSGRRGHLEELGGWVDVVEGEADDAALVSAQCAATTGLIDQYPTDALMSSRDCLGDASLAPPPLAVLGEIRDAVLATLPRLDRAHPVRRWWPAGGFD